MLKLKQIYETGSPLPLSVREVVKSLKGTTIKRYKNNVGKQVGPQIYVHRQYAAEVIPHDVLKFAADALKRLRPEFRFNSVMWNTKTNEIRFDEAPDFDTAREPHVGKYIAILPNGTSREGSSNNIWHHKWLWVKDDYKGFDVDKSKDWSNLWISKLGQIAKGTDVTFAAQLKDIGLKEKLEYPLASKQDLTSYGGVEGWKGKLVWMEPDKFLRLAAPLPDRFRSKHSLRNIEDRILKGLPLDFLALEVDMVKRKVTAHEGRHRAIIAKKMGIEKVPVLIVTGSAFERVPKWKPEDHDVVDKADFKPEISENKQFPMIVYHGGGMEAKKPVLFVTRHLNVAQSYAKENKGKVRKFELNVRNPAGNKVVDEVGHALGIKGINHPDEPSHEFLSPEMIGHEKVVKVIAELERLGYDSAWVNGDFSMDDSFKEYDSFAIWKNGQLKLIEVMEQDLNETQVMNEASQDEAALDFLKKMVRNGPFKGQVYLAGGAVRDMVMGKIPKDLDVVVANHGESGGMDFAKWLAQQMGNYKEGSNPVLFPTFGTAKVVLAGVHNGVDLNGFDVEAVFARKEVYTPGSRKPVVSPGTIEDDAFRRDFTANSLMLDLSTDQMLDITGKGKQDIAAGIIRTTSNPNEIFAQDALRMFRAVRFASKYNWKIEPETWEGIKDNLELLVSNNTSKERIADELGKMLTHANPDIAMELLRDLGLLPYLGKEFQQMVDMTQNKHHVDANGNPVTVFDHTVNVLKGTRPDLLERLIALFHDIGKVVTRTVTPKGVQFIGHEAEGPAIAERIMRDLKYPVDIIKAVKLGISEHMKLKQGGDSAVALSDATLRKFKIKLGKNLETVLRVIHADNMAHAPASQMPNQIANVTKRLIDLRIPEAPELPYDGNEIMKRFNVSGEAVGIIQDMLVNVWYKKGKLSEHDADAIIKGVMPQLPALIQKRKKNKVKR